MRTTPNTALLLALLAAGLTACTRKDATPEAAETPSSGPRARIISEVPTLARARQIDTTGGTDAERQTWQVVWPFDSVVTYYRHMLPTLGFALMNDQADADEVNLYSKKGSASVWMHFTRLSPTLTEWTIIGADSASAGHATPVPPRMP
jgi:hypothetical protein